MANLTTLTDNLNVHQNLPDAPTQSASELKVKFDEAANKIKTYINETLVDELNTILTSLQNGETTLGEAITAVSGVANQAALDIISINGSISTINTTLGGLKSGATTKISVGSSVPETLENGEIYLQYFN